jgi:cell division protein ZapA
MSMENQNESEKVVDSVTITILGKDYQISCPADEEEALRKSARYLDKQMTKIKSKAATLAFENVAVMAALNLSHDFLKNNNQSSESETDFLRDLQKLEKKIDSALLASRQIEI